jgi:diaminopimelate decarboxylase
MKARLDNFTYRSGHLHVDDVAVSDIIADVGTPCYIYSRQRLVGNLLSIREAFAAISPLICFSVKALSNIHLLRELAGAGAGADVVSGGELYRASLAGVPPDRIVYAGVGKTELELRAAVASDIRSVNVESLQEVEALSRVTADLDRSITTAVRVNPNIAVGAATPAKTTTGVRGGKFGVDIESVADVYATICSDSRLRPGGLHFHLGSPIYDPEPYGFALDKLLELAARLQSDNMEVPTINVGGGYPVEYISGTAPELHAFAEVIGDKLKPFVDLGGQVVLEPGRSIAADAGILVARVLYVKASGGRTIAVIDTGMSHHIRPAMYDAFHFIWPVEPRGAVVPSSRVAELELPGLVEYDVVGPICESSDYLARGRRLPPLEPCDLVCIFTSGAYCMTMASQYNSTPRPPEVMVRGSGHQLIRRRETYEDLFNAELGLT